MVIQICVRGTFNSVVVGWTGCWASWAGWYQKDSPSCISKGTLIICLGALTLKQHKSLSNLTWWLKGTAAGVHIALSSELMLAPFLGMCVPRTEWKYQRRHAEMFFWLFSNVTVIGRYPCPYRQKINLEHIEQMKLIGIFCDSFFGGFDLSVAVSFLTSVYSTWINYLQRSVNVSPWEINGMLKSRCQPSTFLSSKCACAYKYDSVRNSLTWRKCKLF